MPGAPRWRAWWRWRSQWKAMRDARRMRGNSSAGLIGHEAFRRRPVAIPTFADITRIELQLRNAFGI